MGVVVASGTSGASSSIAFVDSGSSTDFNYIADGGSPGAPDHLAPSNPTTYGSGGGCRGQI